nr:multiple epidermal growth factor-like domains protein 6 [Crassostrea gigas]
MFEKIHNTSFRLIVVQILTFGIRHSFEDIPRCVGYPFECCPGYMWNYNSIVCEQCMAGYIGRNCTSKCPFPYYGVECQQECNCNQTLCNISTGCIAAAMPSGAGTCKYCDISRRVRTVLCLLVPAPRVHFFT